jgi:hypothetical protein
MARHEPEPTVLQTRHEQVLTCASRAVRTLAITIFTFNITFGAAWSVLVLYARERLGMGAAAAGLAGRAVGIITGWTD